MYLFKIVHTQRFSRNFVKISQRQKIRNTAEIPERILDSTQKTFRVLMPYAFSVRFPRMPENYPEKPGTLFTSIRLYIRTKPKIDLSLGAGRTFHPPVRQRMTVQLLSYITFYSIVSAIESGFSFKVLINPFRAQPPYRVFPESAFDIDDMRSSDRKSRWALVTHFQTLSIRWSRRYSMLRVPTFNPAFCLFST